MVRIKATKNYLAKSKAQDRSPNPLRNQFRRISHRQKTEPTNQQAKRLDQRSHHRSKKRKKKRQRAHLRTLPKRTRLINNQKQGLRKKVNKATKKKKKRRNQTPSGGEEQRRDMN